MSVDYESLFHSSEVELLIPSFSECPPFPSDPSSSRSWWSEAQSSKARDTAFLDEKLVYYVGMSIDDGSGSSSGSDEISPELKQFLSHLQLSMSVSFLPPLSVPPPRRQSHIDPAPISGSSKSTTAELLPPDSTPTGKQSGVDLDFPSVTPMPQPGVKEGDEQYAGVEGQVVFEGDVLDKYKLFRSPEGGWIAVWKSEVLIEYVRTHIQNPVLALTASVTLREAPLRAGHKKGNFSIDTISTRAGGEAFEEEEDGMYGQDDAAGLQEIDLLGGLAGDSIGLPTTRLAQSLRHDLSLPDRIPNSSGSTPTYTPSSLSGRTPTSAGTSPAGTSRDRPAPLSSIQNQNQSLTTLRKSFRQVLALSPGLRVRMRTLLLPQLLPTTTQEDDENEGEKKIVLCVEVENPEHLPFEIDSVNVEIAGKGGQATAELVCQPEQQTGGAVFPLRLGSMEQYNLLYSVSIASAPEERNSAAGVDEAVMRSMGRGDDMRPAAIYLVGRPFQRRLETNANAHAGSDVEYPTSPFSSRWNCQLDLTAYYASSAGSHPNPALPTATTSNRLSKSTLALPPPPPNAVAGDKRYSLATIMSQSSGGGNHRHSRTLAGGPRLPSQAMSTHQGRGPSRQSHNEGLLISVKLLHQPSTTANSSPLNTSVTSKEVSGEQPIRPFDPFSIEIFVHNRTEEVRRFRLSIPPREGEGHIREMMDKRKSQNPKTQDDPALRRSLAKHLSSVPCLVPLESDVRCGPLLPGASLAARLRFMPLRKGVHTVDKLLITGMGDDGNFIMSPVIDVVVE